MNISFNGIMKVTSHKPFEGWENHDIDQFDALRPYYKAVITSKEEDDRFIKAAEDALKCDVKENHGNKAEQLKDCEYIKLNRHTVKPLWETVSDIMRSHELHAVRIKLAALPIELFKSEDKIIYDDTSLEYKHAYVNTPGMHVELDLRNPEAIKENINNSIEKISQYKYIDHVESIKAPEVIAEYKSGAMDDDLIKLEETEKYLAKIKEDVHPPEWYESPF